MPQNMDLASPTYLTDYVLIPNMFSQQECLEIIYADIPSSQAQVVKFTNTTRSELELEQQARKEGPSIHDDGIQKILAGVTTIEEVVRVTHKG